MTEIIIPLGDWAEHLVAAMQTAPHGATIVVNTERKASLAARAAEEDRLNRPDLKFVAREGAGS